LYTRRDLGKIALTSLPVAMLAGTRLRAAAISDAAANGVQLGASTYSFRDLPRTTGADNVDAVVKALQFAGVSQIELSSFDLEPGSPRMGPEPPPPGAYRLPTIPWTPEQLAAAKLAFRNSVRDWRLETPPSVILAHKAAFASAGISVFSWRTDFDETFTDEEIESVLRHANAMGASVVSASSSLTTARRLAPIAEKHNALVAFHTTADAKSPEAISTPANIAAVLAMSKSFRVNLDIGNFTALNLEPVAFIQENHASISHVQIKDRTRNGGGNEFLGEGDTPIQPVLALLKRNKYGIPAFVEYEYIGLGTPRDEVKKCMTFVRSALSAA